MELIWRILTFEDSHQTKAQNCLAYNNCCSIFNSLFQLPSISREGNLYNTFLFPHIIHEISDNISVICKIYNTTMLYGRKVYYPITSTNELIPPENLFQLLQFLSLLPRLFPLDALDKTYTSNTLTSILAIYSEIYRYLNIGDEKNFFSNNLPICFEILAFHKIL